MSSNDNVITLSVTRRAREVGRAGPVPVAPSSYLPLTTVTGVIVHGPPPLIPVPSWPELS